MSRASFLAVFLLAACGRREAPVDTLTTSATVPSASAPPPDASAEPVVADASAPLPPAYERFVAELDAKCPRDSEDTSDGGMIRAEIARANCVASIITADAERLPPEQLAVLLDGTRDSPRGKSKDPVGALWTRTTDASCRVEGFQQWTNEGMQQMGTFERVRRFLCLTYVDEIFAYEVRCRVEGRAADLAEFVEARARRRPDPAPGVKLWARYAKLARRTAPHAALGCEGLICRRTDIEWIDLERDLESVDTGTATLAREVCATWPELAAALGGEAGCQARMAAHWLPLAMEMSGEWTTSPPADAEAQAADKDLPPPADDAYDAATYASRRACASGDEEACAEREHAAARADRALSARAAILAWDTRLGLFRDRLCTMDDAGRFVAFSPSPKSWLEPPARRGGWRATGLMLMARVLRLSAAGDIEGLAKHMSAREAWGEAVERGLGLVQDHFKKPCQKAPASDCAAAARRLAGALADASALGAELCRASPDLARALGEPRCASVVGRYALSLGVYLGRPDMMGR